MALLSSLVLFLSLLGGGNGGGEDMQQRASGQTGARAGPLQPCGIWSPAHPVSHTGTGWCTFLTSLHPPGHFYFSRMLKRQIFRS